MDREIVTVIGKKIKQLRQQKKLTIQELSEKSNISKGLLSKIENSRAIPSMPVFLSIVKSLDVPLRDFFEDMVLTNGASYLHIKKEDYRPFQREDRQGFFYKHILEYSFTNISLEVAILDLEPGAKGDPTVTDGFEFKYILKGSLEYHLEDEVIILNAGDSIFFDASKPHIPVNRSDTQVSMLVLYFISPKS